MSRKKLLVIGTEIGFEGRDRLILKVGGEVFYLGTNGYVWRSVGLSRYSRQHLLWYLSSKNNCLLVDTKV